MLKEKMSENVKALTRFKSYGVGNESLIKNNLKKLSILLFIDEREKCLTSNTREIFEKVCKTDFE